MGKKRITWIELLRIVSILAVITLHTASFWFKSSDVYSFHWAVSSVYFTAGKLGVGCFTMISGALFLSSSKSDDFHYIFKHIRRIIIVFIVWSAIYCIESIGKSMYAGQNLNIKSLISFFVVGRIHLWYLYMISGLYLITPILRAFVRNKTLCIYFIILCIVFSYIPNVLMTAAPAIYDKYLFFMNEKLHLHMVIGYAGYYVTGFYIVNYGLSDKHKKILYIAGAIGIIFAVSGAILFSRHIGKQDAFNNNLTVTIFLFCAAVLTAFKSTGESGNGFIDSHKTGITYIGSCTFGIYLIHLLIQDLVLSRIVNLLPQSFCIITFPLAACVIFGLSLLAVSIMKKIPVVKKIV